jgi:hypothetical protein
VLDETFYQQPFTVAEIVATLKGTTWNEQTGAPALSARASALKGALPGFLAEAMDRDGFFQKRTGKFFSRHVGRRFGKAGVHIQRGDTSHGAQQWRIGGLEGKNEG